VKKEVNFGPKEGTIWLKTEVLTVEVGITREMEDPELLLQ
jgi:hypothetical protein